MSYAISKSLNDLKYKTISSETDKIGFFLVCKDLLEIPFLNGYIRDIIKKRKNGYNFLPIKESKFIVLSAKVLNNDCNIELRTEKIGTMLIETI